MKTESHTPRTDALMPDQGQKRTMLEHIEAMEAHARQLERELDTCKELVEHYSKLATINGIDAGIAQNALKKEREWVSRDHDKLRDLLKQINQIIK